MYAVTRVPLVRMIVWAIAIVGIACGSEVETTATTDGCAAHCALLESKSCGPAECSAFCAQNPARFQKCALQAQVLVQCLDEHRETCDDIPSACSLERYNEETCRAQECSEATCNVDSGACGCTTQECLFGDFRAQCVLDGDTETCTCSVNGTPTWSCIAQSDGTCHLAHSCCTTYLVEAGPGR
jgi:hypothetical protein